MNITRDEAERGEKRMNIETKPDPGPGGGQSAPSRARSTSVLLESVRCRRF